MSRKIRSIGKTMAAALVFGLATFSAPRAHASELDFSYTESIGYVLSGTFDGTLLSDGNVFDVSSVSSLFVNGVAVAGPSYIAQDIVVEGRNTAAAVSLDGSYMDLLAFNGFNDFAFAAGIPGAGSVNTAWATQGYGGTGSLEVYNPSDWSASLVATTPESSSLVLCGTGILGLAGVARRKFLRS
jgi:hypothetical protein